MNLDEQSGAQVSIRPAIVVITLTIASVLIVSAGAVAHIIRHQVIVDLDDPRADVLRRLDIVEEPSLSQWFSSSLHLSVACLTAGIGLSIGRNTICRWIGLSVLFCFASLDEAVMIHEMMDRPTREYFGTSGILTIAWIIPGACIAMTIGLLYLSFLRTLTYRIATLFVIAAAVFLSGAILMEIPGGYLYERYGFASWHYIASYALEEVLEMLGLIIFVYGLLCHISVETQSRGESSLGITIDFPKAPSSEAVE